MFFCFLIEEMTDFRLLNRCWQKKCYNFFGKGYEEDKIFSIENERSSSAEIFIVGTNLFEGY